MDLASLVSHVPNEGRSPLLDKHFGLGRRIARSGFLLSGLVVLPALIWVAAAPLASAVVATGVVKVDLNRAVIQHVEGGTVRVVHVRDGQRVKAGDPLIELGDVSVNADRTRLSQRLSSERAGQARLEAEQMRRQSLVFPSDVVVAGQQDPVIQEQMAKEQALFGARLTSMNSSLALLAKQRDTIRQEMVALRATVRSTEESIAVQGRELALNQRMAREGLVSDTQVMQLEARLADYRGRIAQNNADLTRAEQRIGDIELRANQVQNDYKQQASDQLKVTLMRVQEIEQELRKATDASKRQVIKAPIDGEVIGLRVTSVGAVISPREPIAEIVPSNPRLIVEAQIHPEDVARVHKGQHADLRFTAFAYRTTKMAPGEVSYVGADRMVQRENGMPYYLINVDVDPAVIKQAVGGDENAKLQAGMPAEVYVRGGERTALQYLVEPLTQLMRRAARER